MPLSHAVRNQIVSLKTHTSMSNQEIAKRLEISPNSVSRIWKFYVETGSLDTQYGEHCGRPSTLSERDKRAIVIAAKRDPMATSKEVQRSVGSSVSNISTRRVRQIILHAGQIAYRPVKKPALTLKQKRARLYWAKHHSTMSPDDWNKVRVRRSSVTNETLF